jgi:hypothetical protein
VACSAWVNRGTRGVQCVGEQRDTCGGAGLASVTFAACLYQTGDHHMPQRVLAPRTFNSFASLK